MTDTGSQTDTANVKLSAHHMSIMVIPGLIKDCTYLRVCKGENVLVFTCMLPHMQKLKACVLPLLVCRIASISTSQDQTQQRSLLARKYFLKRFCHSFFTEQINANTVRLHQPQNQCDSIRWLKLFMATSQTNDCNQSSYCHQSDNLL